MGKIEDGLNELGFFLQNSKQEKLSVELTDAITEFNAGRLSFAILSEMSEKAGLSQKDLDEHIAVAEQGAKAAEEFLNSGEKKSSEFQKEKDALKNWFNGTLDEED